MAGSPPEAPVLADADEVTQCGTHTLRWVAKDGRGVLAVDGHPVLGVTLRDGLASYHLLNGGQGTPAETIQVRHTCRGSEGRHLAQGLSSVLTERGIGLTRTAWEWGLSRLPEPMGSDALNELRGKSMWRDTPDGGIRYMTLDDLI